MAILNKPAIVAEVADKTGNSKAEVDRILSAFQEVVMDSVAQGDEVKLSGFLALSQATRPARKMRSPRTGEEIDVAESKTPKVRALKTFRDRVSE